MDREIAVTVVAAASPSVERQAQTLFYRTRSFVAARVPARLPAHDFVGYLQLFRVDFGSRLKQVDVLLYEVERVHVELAREIVKCAPCDNARLRMVGRPPGPLGTNVVYHSDVLYLLVWQVQRQRIRYWR